MPYKNKEDQKHYFTLWYTRYKQEFKEYIKIYRKLHIDDIRESNKKLYAKWYKEKENRDYRLQYYKKWYINNKEHKRNYHKMQKIKKLNKTESIIG